MDLFAGTHDLGLFVLSVLLLNLTPGPDTAYILGRSVAQGRVAGVLSALGIAAGCCVHALLAAGGLTALLAASPLAFALLKYAGAAYLVWLGVRLWRTSGHAVQDAPAAAPRGASAAAPHAAHAPAGLAAFTPRRLFVQGLLTNLLNPKVILFFVSFFPQFVDPAAGGRFAPLFALGLVFVAMSGVYTCAIAWIAGTLTRALRGRARVRVWLARCTGALFVLIGCKLAFVRAG